jgi:hypothetical protein
MMTSPQVAQLQSQMSSQRALVGTQHAIMAIAILAMGTGWAAPALWGLAAAAVGGLVAVLLGWGADDSAAAAERSSAALELLGAQRRASQQRAAGLAAGAGAGAGAGGAGGSGGSSPRLRPVNVPGGKSDGRGALRVLAAASEGSSASDAPAPATAAVEALQCGRVIRGKSIDSLVRLACNPVASLAILEAPG